MRGLKPAIVSFHIDRLVGEGFLQRQPVPGDRRKTALVLHRKGSARHRSRAAVLQQSFADRLTERPACGGLSALPPLRRRL